MQFLHNRLCELFPRYEQWHQDTYAPFFTWAIFIMFALVFGSVLLAAISENISSTQSSLATQMTVVRSESKDAVPTVATDIERVRTLNVDILGYVQGDVDTTALRALLSERQTRMLRIVPVDPTSALTLVLAASVRSALPADLQSFVEVPTSVSGVYRPIAVVPDNEHPQDSLQGQRFYFLTVSDTERYSLAITASDAKGLITDDHITVDGDLFQNNILLPLTPIVSQSK